MNFKTLLTVAALACTAGAFAAAADDHHHHGAKPQNGGILAEASDIEFELVAKADALTIYVRDHGKPLATQGASGKITVLAGAQKTEAALGPAGENRMQAKGSFKVAPGTKFVATVTLAGKQPLSTRFALK